MQSGKRFSFLSNFFFYHQYLYCSFFSYLSIFAPSIGYSQYKQNISVLLGQIKVIFHSIEHPRLQNRSVYNNL